MNIKAIIIFALLAIVFLPVALSDGVDVACESCGQLIDSATASKTFKIDQGTAFTLSAPGIDEGHFYHWEENGKNVGKGASLAQTAENDTRYALVKNFPNGQRQNVFWVTLKVIKKSVCPPPGFDSEIHIDGDEYLKDQKKNVVIGQEYDLWIDIKESDCQDYSVEWSITPEVADFASANSRETTMTVNRYSAQNPELAVKIFDAERKRSVAKHTHLAVVKAFPPHLEIRYDAARSYTPFKVYLNGTKPGTGYIEHIAASLYDSDGDMVADDYADVDENDPLPVLKLKPDAAGEYELRVSVTDNYGKSTEENKKIVATEGDTGEDDPVFQKQKTIECVEGQICVINALDMVSGGKENIGKIEFKNSAGKKITNYKGDDCCCGECAYWPAAGTHTVKIIVYEFGDDDDGTETFVTVNVLANNSAPMPEPQEPLPQPPEETPPPKGMALFAIFLALRCFKKIHQS